MNEKERTQKERYYDALIYWCVAGCVTTRSITDNLGIIYCQNKYGEKYGDSKCTGCPCDNRKYMQLSKLNRRRC